MKKLLTFIGLLMIAAAIGIIQLDSQAARRDCDNYAIMKCGVYSASEFQQKFKENPHKDLAQIFSHYGVPTNLAGAKEGKIMRNGDVYVGSKLVATGAQVASRGTLSNGRVVNVGGGVKVYERAASYSTTTREGSAPAFVFLNQYGEFVSAVIKSCGNPVSAKPKPTPRPAAKCEYLKATLKGNQYTLVAKANVSGGATVSSYRFVITDRNGKNHLDRVVTTTNHSSTIMGTLAPGSYTAKVTINTSLGGKDCATTINIPKPPVEKMKVCDLTSGKIITIDKDDYNSAKHGPTDAEECNPKPPVEKMKVCDLSSGKIITIDKDAYDSAKHGPTDAEECNPKPPVEKMKVCDLATGNIVTIDKDAYDSAKHGSTDAEECNPKPPVEKMKVCDLSSGKIITIDKDDYDSAKHGKTSAAECNPTPVPPSELPTTGISDFVPFIGLGSLVASIGYFVSSRRF